MSQYISFYVKSNGGEMLPIGTFCRSTKVYQYGQYSVASYSVVEPLTSVTLQSILDEIKGDIDDYQKRITKEDNRIKMILAATGTSVDDKVSQIDDYFDNIEYLKDELTEVKQAYAFYLMLRDNILDEAKNSQYYYDERFKYDPNAYIYAGVECARYADEIEEA